MARRPTLLWHDPAIPPPGPDEQTPGYHPLPQSGARWRGPFQIQVYWRRRGMASMSATCRDWKSASEWLAAREAETATLGRTLDKGLISRTTLAEALQAYSKERTEGKRGAAQEKLRVRYWVKHPLGARLISSLSARDFQEWIDERVAAGAAPSTITNALSPISQTYKWLAVQPGFEGLRAMNPIASILRPKGRPGREARLTEAEEAALLTACGKSKAKWLLPLVELALWSAMRQGEIRALRWSDIHLSERWLRVREAKDTRGTRIRDVPLVDQRALAVLGRLKREPVPGASDDALFPPLRPEKISAVFKTSANKAGLPLLRFHDLRHVATTRLSRRISSPLELGRVTGHRSIAALSIYYNPSAAELAKKYGG